MRRAGMWVGALLVSASCGGQAVHSKNEADGLGGAASTPETVSSTEATQAASTSAGGGPVSVVTSSTSGGTEWGGAPVPAACVLTGGAIVDDAYCEIGVDCAGDAVVAMCWAAADGGGFSCESKGAQWQERYDLSGVDASNACSYAIAAYFRAPVFETASYGCERIVDNHDAEECSSTAGCERDAVLGGVTLTASDYRVTNCSAGPWGWTCDCYEPAFGVRFDIPNVTTTTLCLEARDWCGGESLVLNGSRTCSATAISADSDSCQTWLTCSQGVAASGMEATMHELVPMSCHRSSDELYECSCLHRSNFDVIAPDSGSACSLAAGRCTAD